MNMSSQGTFAVCNNRNINNNEVNVCSTENNYSLPTFSVQTEVFNPKIVGKAKFNKNKKARRTQTRKDLRKGGNPHNVPKRESNQKKQNIPSRYTHQSDVEFVHQSLLEHVYPASILEFAKLKLASLGTNVQTAQVVQTLETLALLSVTLPTMKDPTTIAAQLALGLRTMMKGSITEMILSQKDTIGQIKEMFGYNIFSFQSSDLNEESTSWLEQLPNLKDNWEQIRHAPVFGKISTMISIAASIGLCSVTNLSWSFKGVELFKTNAMSKHHTAMDLVSAVLDTVICFLEGGYQCFKEGSFKPFFFSDDESLEFDQLYFPLVEAHEHAMLFNLHDKPVTIKGITRYLNDLEYGQYLDEAIDMATKLYKSAKGTWQQNLFEKRLDILIKNRAAYNAKRIDGSMRFAPFTAYLWGKSGRGKSALSQILMADLLRAAGVNPDPANTAVLKETDKYDSSLKGHTYGIYYDDCGNTKPEFLDKSPTDRIIDINNNMITYANKADLHEKGKVEIRPRIFLITSNLPLSCHASTGSVNEYSIVRRADVHLYLEVKEEFALPDGRLDSAKVNRSFPAKELVNDIWNIDIYRPLDKEAGGDQNSLRHIDGVKDTKKRNIYETLKYCTTACKEHFANQQKLIIKNENLIASRKYCDVCNLGHDICECSTENQASFEESFEFIRTQLDNIGDMTHRMLNFVPNRISNNSLIKNLYCMCNYRDLMTFEKKLRGTLIFTFLMSFIVLTSLNQIQILLLSAMSTLLHLFLYVGTLSKWRDDRFNELISRRYITKDLFKSIRESKLCKFVGACATAGILYKLVSIIRVGTSAQQAILAPESYEEILARDRDENPWANPVVAELHVSDKSKTMTIEQVTHKVKKNLCHATFVENGFQQSCDILALFGTTFLMPYHVWKNRNEMQALIVKSEGDFNSQFKARLSRHHMMPIKGKDLCIVHIPSCGVFGDIRHLLPDKTTASGSGRFLYRHRDGTCSDDKIKLNYIKDSESGGPGYAYKLPFNTFTGLCTGIAVADFARKFIASIHLRGVTGEPHGKGVILPRDLLDEAVQNATDVWRGAFPTASSGTFPVMKYDKQVLVSTDIHPNSPINYLPKYSTVEYIGQDNRRCTYTSSSVVETPISKTVTEVTGVENKFGPPKFNQKRMWQATLEHSANASVGIRGDALTWAFDDYVDGCLAEFKRSKHKNWIKDELRPLTPMETLCGIDGRRFVDAMKRNTSIGYPLSGTKEKYINLLDPELFPDFDCPAEIDPIIAQEAADMEAKLLKGERAYFMFKACVKDEPTKKTSEKVRVFQAAEAASQLLIRKYFLPICRILSLFPLTSECAVGVNAQGPEWDVLAKHMAKHGTDRIFAGDYSKYDLRMPAQLILAAFGVLIKIAQECGDYTEDDITIMRGIATEIAYSCVSFNGDLLIMLGSNPSGQNLTVYINCIVNSLLMRSAFFMLQPKNTRRRPFRKACSVMTYGDDVKGSVAPGYDWFNHISYAKYLAEHDMVFTMPDKESVPTEYMLDSDADFLKRKNVFNPDTGLMHGALDENSIFKSLHAVMVSDVVSLQDQCAGNIDGALREWWQHGRDVYEVRRGQMQEIASREGLTHMCSLLDETYEDRLHDFLQKYMGDSELCE